MQQFAKKPWRKIGWGAPASVALHLFVAFLLLVHLPEEPPKLPDERSVSVELVPPPPSKREEKPREDPAKTRAEPPRPQPQAFESAAARAEQEMTEAQLPPVRQMQDISQAPKNASPERSKAETAKREVPPEIKPALPELAVPEVNAATQRSEKEEPSTQKSLDAVAAVQSMPVPERKPSPNTQHPSRSAEAKVERQSNELVHARELFSPKTLSDPHVRQAMGELPPKKRILQLCSIEALEQIRHQKPGAYPDMLVPYGPTGGFISNSALNAKGGAFRSGAKWYDVAFRCEVDADTTAVVSFSFAIGGAVSKNEWTARRLPAD